MLLSYNLLKKEIYSIFTDLWSYKNNSICIFYLLYSHDGIAQSITVNDTYTAQNLVNILTNNSTCSTTSTYSVSGDTFQGLRKLWFF
jgi:hypothetical protein